MAHVHLYNRRVGEARWGSVLFVAILFVVFFVIELGGILQASVYAANVVSAVDDSSKTPTKHQKKSGAKPEKKKEKNSHSVSTDSAQIDLISSLNWEKPSKKEKHLKKKKVPDSDKNLSRTMAEIFDVLQSHNQEIHDCYHRHLKINPTIKGVLCIRFGVNPDGTVFLAAISKSTVDNERFEKDILQVIKSWDDFGTCSKKIGQKFFKQDYEFGQK